MSEEKKSIPKPDIKETPPATPPVTSVDQGEEQSAKVEKEESVKPASDSGAGGVQVDLVNRFLGALVDCLVAGVIGGLVGMLTGMMILNYIIFGLIILVRDSLPFLEGQSIGKKVMKTKAVKEDGSSLSGDWVTGATRNILMAIPFGGLVEGIIILTRSGNPEDGKRLGDDWAKTKVISVE